MKVKPAHSKPNTWNCALNQLFVLSFHRYLSVCAQWSLTHRPESYSMADQAAAADGMEVTQAVEVVGTGAPAAIQVQCCFNIY